MAAPSMKERQACWGARDLYWRCLDDNAEDAARCQKLRSSFEARCPQQWVLCQSQRRLRGLKDRPGNIQTSPWSLKLGSVNQSCRRSNVR
ncbi:cytochrome c oxidase assembly factor 6 homolog isoform X1 [Grammomys surdaster]|uniref:cytochrome c oxidase assembly factor 6 homolog isoform X1 n=1 Tax=Grammomys surdaster TaxID=491861 RepID=UPI00109F96FE|nr:cytochrome c oxidase assembly factor 6 homolog isoform X1 [Grammomys surdaster]